MLDKSKIGEKKHKQPLKCEECGFYFKDNPQERNDREHIDETGYCTDCAKDFQIK